MKQVDARGYSCPTPVLMVQKELKASAPAELEVLVDDKCAMENVSRLAANSGYEAASKADGDEFVITLTKK